MDSSDSLIGEEEVKPAHTWKTRFKAWPKSTICVFGYEFCGKLSYMGIRSIYALYFLNVLNFNDKYSIIFFTGFSFLNSLTYLLGAYLADKIFGKYKTIIIGATFAIIAQIVLTFSSFNNSESSLHPFLDLASFLIIALSTGIVGPCVSPFGGDQFEPNDKKMSSLFMELNYYISNISAIIATFVAPLLRSTPCLGQDSCYPLVFGTSVMWLIIATTIFLLGNCFIYKKRDVLLRRNPDNETVDRSNAGTEVVVPNSHNSDSEALIKMLVMYLSLPIFWALYNQQFSIWLIQGLEMNTQIWDGTLLLPDQMRLMNPLLVLCLYPILKIIIYPSLSKIIQITLLRKMIVGMFFIFFAFISAGIVQIQINKTLVELPQDKFGFISVMNNLKPNCSISGIGDYPFNWLEYNNSLSNNKQTNNFEMLKVPSGHNITFHFHHSCENENYVNSFIAPEINSKNIYNLIITELGAVMLNVDPVKPRKGTGEFSLSLTMALNDTNYEGDLALCKVDSNVKNPYCNPLKLGDFHLFKVLNSISYETPHDDKNFEHLATEYNSLDIKPGNWNLWYSDQFNFTSTGKYITISEQGGIYAAVFTGTFNSPIYHVNQFASSNTISILWQFPQFFLLSMAEVLFSMTGESFAYTHAPQSYKTVIKAAWTLTGAAGDLIILSVAALNIFDNLVYQFFSYAGAMLVAILIFSLLTIFYYNREISENEEGENNDYTQNVEDMDRNSDTEPLLIG